MALKWMPLESNPEVMNSFLRDLGLPEPWCLTDIYSFDEDAMNMVPQPSLAVLLLLPITQKYIEMTEKLEKEAKETDPVLRSDGVAPYFMKQTISNACGTVALIHAIANNMDNLLLSSNSILKKFLDQTHHLNAEDRGRKLEENIDIANLHESGAQEGQTETPGLDDDVDLHFVALIRIGDKLVEFDGRKSRPIVHGLTNEEDFLMHAFSVAKAYIALDPTNVRFGAMSLGPPSLQ